MATLIAPMNHSPKEDADVLWKAVKGQIQLFKVPSYKSMINSQRLI